MIECVENFNSEIEIINFNFQYGFYCEFITKNNEKTDLEQILNIFDFYRYLSTKNFVYTSWSSNHNSSLTIEINYDQNFKIYSSNSDIQFILKLNGFGEDLALEITKDFEDKIANKTMFEASSWGKKYYVKWEDFRDHKLKMILYK